MFYRYKRWIVYLCAAFLSPLMAIAGDGPGYVNVETDAHNIKSNQPFHLTLTLADSSSDKSIFDSVYSFKTKIDSGWWKNTSVSSNIELKTDDFTIIGSPSVTSTMTFINGVTTGKTIYTYTLVPLRAGKLHIMPFSVKKAGVIYICDTITIPVLEGKIPASDSIQRLKTANLFDSDFFTSSTSKNKSSTNSTSSFIDDFFNKNQETTANEPDGVHFDHPDWKYPGVVGQPINVMYSISFVNVAGMSTDELNKAYIKKYACPKGLTLVNFTNEIVQSSKYKIFSSKQKFTKVYTMTVKTDKKGVYTIPPLTVQYRDKQYTAPKVKVVVE